MNHLEHSKTATLELYHNNARSDKSQGDTEIRDKTIMDDTAKGGLTQF